MIPGAVSQQMLIQGGEPPEPTGPMFTHQNSSYAVAGSGTSQTITMPTSSEAIGDLGVLWFMSRSAVSTPAGWTLITSISVTASGVTQYHYLYSKVLVSGDIGTTFSITQATSNRMSYVFSHYRKTRSGTPTIRLAATGSNAAMSSAAMTVQPITPDKLDQQVIVAISRVNAGVENVTVPAGYEGRPTSPGGVDIRLRVADKLVTELSAISGSFNGGAGTTGVTQISAVLDLI